MNNAENAIDKVLAGLRDAEAAPGMERRILEAVEARALQRPVARPPWAWSAAFAGVVAVSILVAIATIHRHEQPPAQAHLPAIPTEPASGPQPALLQPPGTAAPTRSGNRQRKKPATISAADALLLSEMRAPSHPAPEAPLTEEEKLLLRAVRTGDPQVIAMLDPEERARQDAAGEAEFQKFLGQSGNEIHESDQTTE
jgi:hypothetical protein